MDMVDIRDQLICDPSLFNYSACCRLQQGSKS